MDNSNCIFCKIVAGKAPSHQIFEDDNHLAFLDLYPGECRGKTVVIPKQHHSSSLVEVNSEALQSTVLIAQKVAKILRKVYKVDWVRMSLFGTEVKHLHIGLSPVQGVDLDGNKLPGDRLDQDLALIKEQVDSLN